MLVVWLNFGLFLKRKLQEENLALLIAVKILKSSSLIWGVQPPHSSLHSI